MIYCTAASEDDIFEILRIEREAISPPWTHGALLGEIYREDAFFAAARCDDVTNASRVVGFVILQRMGDDGELLQIAVDTASRRLGVADLLMTAMLCYAERKGLTSVFLEARKGNIAAISLCTKHGFTEVRTRKDYYSGPVEDAIVMARELKGMVI